MIPRKPKKEWSASLNHPTPPEPRNRPVKAATPVSAITTLGKRQKLSTAKAVSKKPALRKTKLKPVSPKRAGWLAQYAAEKKRRGQGPHKCIVCGATIIIGQNASWHHRSGRRTLADLLDFVPVCEIPCHHAIHSSPSTAIEKGWLSKKYRGL